MFTQILRQKITLSTTTKQRQLHHTQIYRNLFILLSAFILFGSTCSSEAVEFGAVKYNNAFIDYTKIDKESTLKLADFYFDKALNTQDFDEKKEFLQKASGNYFILTQLEPDNIYTTIQLARVYDYEKQDSFAKAYFYKALRINKKDPITNYYFGEFFYTREEYTKAIRFYNIAFENGQSENNDVIIKLAIMYEKLGDLLRANMYYKKAYLANPSKELANKIREIEAIKYRNTGYYNIIRRKK
ncbi:hypothetical protein IKL64_08090 [bacterium]|nr:hypothetical protein [bacterium]